MLSMFKDKKGFSALFEERDGSDCERLSRSNVGLQQRSMHRCERCGKHFSESANAPQLLFVCAVCEYPTCSHCREVSKHPKYCTDWLCCECNLPQSFTRFFKGTRTGATIVAKVLEFCDPRAERIMLSLFRNTVPLTYRSQVSANKRIKQERNNLKSGGLSSRSPNQSQSGKPRRSSGDAGSIIIRRRNSKSNLRHPFLVSEDKENSTHSFRPLNKSETRLSEYSNTDEVRKSNLTPFEREPPRTMGSMEDRPRTTCGSLSITEDPCQADDDVDSASARSESPAPRFPTFTEFLGDQKSTGPSQKDMIGSIGIVSISPNSEEEEEGVTVPVAKKSRTTGSSNRPTGKVASETAHTPPLGKKSTSTGFTSRSVHRILFCSESNTNSPAATLSNPPTPMTTKKSTSQRNSLTDQPSVRKKKTAPLSTRTGGKTLRPNTHRPPTFDENGRRIPSNSAKLQRNASKNPNFERNASSKNLVRTASSTKQLSQTSADSKFSSTTSSTKHLNSPKGRRLMRNESGIGHLSKSTFDRTASLTVIPGTKLARTPSSKAGISVTAQRQQQGLTRTNSSKMTRTMSSSATFQRSKSSTVGAGAGKGKTFTRCATAVTKRSTTPNKTSGFSRTNTKTVISSERPAGQPDQKRKLQRTNTAKRYEERTATSSVKDSSKTVEGPPQLVHMTRRRRNPQPDHGATPSPMTERRRTGQTPTGKGTSNTRPAGNQGKTDEKFRRHNSSLSPLVRQKSHNVF